MLKGKKILAVVPARGGSKGVALKNLRHVRDVPIVARVGHCIADITCIDRAVVSTDHEEIARVAEGAGLAAPFRRPAALSGDRIGDLEVLVHALCEMERIDDVVYDVVLMLQPTAPLRTAEQVQATLDKLVDDGLDAVWTVTPTDLKYHPLKQLALDGERLTFNHPDGAAVIARQQLQPVYHRNGVAYAFSRDCLLEQSAIMGRRTGAIVIPGPSVSIDVEDDFAVIERLLDKSA
jgi:CMP-N,N'-diacetyllegionaminic acid synthase